MAESLDIGGAQVSAKGGMLSPVVQEAELARGESGCPMDDQ
jgi:hypothetical protein